MKVVKIEKLPLKLLSGAIVKSVTLLLKVIKSLDSSDTLYDKIKSLSGSVAFKESVNEASSANV